MRFGLLGPLEVWTDDGRPVGIPERKVRVVLTDLLAHEGRLVPTDQLITDVWGDDLPVRPAGALQAKVSLLRRALADAEPGARDLVEWGGSGYRLRTDGEAVDTIRFQRLIRQAHTAGDVRARAALLSEALALWRGPVLVDVADYPFAQPVIARLEDLRLTALEEQANARLGLGEHHLLVAELTDLVSRYPLRERLRAAQLRALYRSGRRHDALASYQDFRIRLRDELGLDPGPELVALQQAILVQDPVIDAPTAPVAHRRTNLPTPLTELVGRAEAVTEVANLLETRRLVTLTGPGGVGKTRLAYEVAARMSDRFPGGVWVTDLAQPVEVTEAVAAMLGLRDEVATGAVAGPERLIDRLIGAVPSTPTLLVLDNCEAALAGVAQLCGELLSAASDLRVLATSQARLGIAGEELVDVSPLAVPEPTAEHNPAALRAYGAVQLFVARAAAAAPGFTVDDGNVAAVAAICRRLDGIPLALELAATRVRALGVRELACRLDDRFQLLSAGTRGAPARHQTLRATLDWSWELLSGPERAVLRRLAVHSGGFTLEAAEVVCAGDEVARSDVLGLLAHLVDRSLVTTSDSEGGRRYRLLESVAAYATERLFEAGEVEQVRQRHCDYYTEWVERATARLRGPEQRRWLLLLDDEVGNLRTALATALGRGEAQGALRLADAAAWYWYLRGRLRECHRWLTEALALAGPAPAGLRTRAEVWRTGLAVAVHASADLETQVRAALRPYQDGLRIDAPTDRAWAHWFLAATLLTTAEPMISQALLDRALADFGARDDHWGVAAVLSARTWAWLLRGDLAALARDGEQSLRLFRDLGDQWGQVQAIEPLAMLAEITGNYPQAMELYREGLRTAEELGLWTEVSWKLAGLGRVTTLTGDYPRGRELLERALRMAREQSDVYGQQYAQLGLGLAARRQGRLDEAERQLRGVLDRRSPAGDTTTAWVLAELGYLAEMRGDAAAALALQRDAAAAARTSGDPRAIALALEGLAGAWALGGEPRRAARLLGGAAAAREAGGAGPARRAGVRCRVPGGSRPAAHRTAGRASVCGP